MICQSCRSDNLDDAEFCSACGVQLAEQVGDSDWLAGLVADADAESATSSPTAIDTPIGGPPTEPVDLPIAPPTPTPTPLDTTAAMPDTAPAPAPAPAPGEPTTVGSTVPPFIPAARVVETPPMRRSSSLPILLGLAGIAAFVIIGALVFLRSPDDSETVIDGTEIDGTDFDEATTPITAPPVDTEPDAVDPEPTVPMPTDPAVIESDTTVSEPVDAETTVPTATAPPTTVTSTTVAPSTTAAPTPTTTEPAATPTTAPPTPDDPAAIPPLPDEPGPIDAVGSPQVLANVMPSGLAFTEVEDSFAVAQEFGDALALEDWDTARLLAPGTSDSTDSEFELGYGATNRISLMLVDATDTADGQRLAVVSVAVENDGDQTSLYCLVWDVNPTARTVEQASGRRIERWADNVQPETIRNDPAAMATVTSCEAL